MKSDLMKSDSGQNSYCLWDTHEAIITKEDFAQVQKEIDRRTRKRRMHASAASKLIESVGWPDPIKRNQTDVPDSKTDRGINWSEPEE